MRFCLLAIQKLEILFTNSNEILVQVLLLCFYFYKWKLRTLMKFQRKFFRKRHTHKRFLQPHLYHYKISGLNFNHFQCVIQMVCSLYEVYWLVRINYLSIYIWDIYVVICQYTTYIMYKRILIVLSISYINKQKKSNNYFPCHILSLNQV